MQESDVSNYTPPSSHRLPTVSASEALKGLSETRNLFVSTGLPGLNLILQSNCIRRSRQEKQSGGLPAGQLTEIYGPPGVGKTTFGIQASAQALHAGNSVVWIDTGHPLVGSKLRDIILHTQNLESQGQQLSTNTELLEKFHHFVTPTLPHLLTILAHPLPSFPPHGTSLIVVDTVSSVFANAFPRVNERPNEPQTPAKKNASVQWAAGRRWAVMGEFLSRLGKLAAIRNIAVLLLSQMTTKIGSSYGALLRPAILSRAWEEGISTRIVLFRDWPALSNGSNQEQQGQSVIFAGVVKHAGRIYDGVGIVVAFTVETGGLRELQLPAESMQAVTSPLVSSLHLKRKSDEIADSQSEDELMDSDEDFGWNGDDSGPVQHTQAEDTFDYRD